MSTATRKGRPREHDRAALLAAVRQVAAVRGFDNLRFVDVSEATDVPVSSLQYAFGTRDALVRDVLRAGVAAELQRLSDAVTAQTDPWGQIEAFIRRSLHADEQDRHEGWLLWIEYWRASLRDESLRRDYVGLARSWRLLLQAPIERGAATGAFTLVGTPAEVAAVLVGLVDGLALQLEVGDNQLRPSMALAAAVKGAQRILGVT